MNRLLRAHDVNLVSGRKTVGGRAATPSPSNPLDVRDAPHHAPAMNSESEQLRRRIVELENRAVQQASEFEASEQAAYQRGMDEGMERGASQVRRDHEAQLSILRSGVDAALEGFQQKLQSVDALALDLAHLALEKILGNSDAYAELIRQTARHHLAQLSDNAAIGVRVSPDDFSDAERLHAAFGDLLAQSTLSVRADPQLPAGACLIDLTLGRLDVGLAQQKAHALTALQTLRGDA